MTTPDLKTTYIKPYKALSVAIIAASLLKIGGDFLLLAWANSKLSGGMSSESAVPLPIKILLSPMGPIIVYLALAIFIHVKTLTQKIEKTSSIVIISTICLLTMLPLNHEKKHYYNPREHASRHTMCGSEEARREEERSSTVSRLESYSMKPVQEITARGGSPLLWISNALK